jgi:superfamily II DNA or RNA helicase
MDYEDFLRSKARRAKHRGLMDREVDLSPLMFGYQADTTRFLLQAGSGSAFLDTGMGKSFIELEWGRVVREHTNKPVLMLAPLAVGPQHVREAQRFGIDDVRTVRSQDDIKPGINVANYERLHLFDPSEFGGIVLDESSIIKNYTGKTTRALMAFADAMPFRLCATATPAPNDHMELGQHSQFLGVMDSSEMLARWFIADQSEMGRYRLKRHGIKPFWSWVASWARCLTKPSDLGYSDDGFQLPSLNIIRHSVDVDISAHADGELFRRVDASATAIHKEKRLTSADRAERAAEIVSGQPNEPCVVWVETDYDADAVMARLPGAVEVRGSMTIEQKESRLNDFSTGNIRVLVTKPRVAGFGLNWQHCAHTVFAGLSFSYEQFYQATRRFWRYGQQRTVDCHVVMAETEEMIWRNIQRKANDHEAMKLEMAEAMRRETISSEVKQTYSATKSARIPSWLAA